MRRTRLGSGSYGCVYSPAIQCTTELDPDKFVSKLMHEPNAIQEIENAEIIDQVDSGGIFHYPIIDSCPTTFAPSKCDDCSQGDTECDETCCDVPVKQGVVITYENGGVQLDHFDYNSIEVGRLRNFFLSLWRLFFGLFVMHNNDIYHLDIKPANILIKKKIDEELVVIKFNDFGFLSSGTSMEVPKYLKKMKHVFKRPYIYHPPEAILLTIPEGKSRDDMIDLVNQSLIYRIVGIGIYYPGLKSVYNYDNKLAATIVDSLMPTYLQDIQTFRRYLYTRIDVYSLGMSIYSLLNPLFNGLVEKEDDLNILLHMRSLVRMMSQLNVGDRVGPYDAFMQYVRLMNGTYKVDYRQLVKEAQLMLPQQRQIDLTQAKQTASNSQFSRPAIYTTSYMFAEKNKSPRQYNIEVGGLTNCSNELPFVQIIADQRVGSLVLNKWFEENGLSIRMADLDIEDFDDTISVALPTHLCESLRRIVSTYKVDYL